MRAWNAHDVEAVLAHFRDDVVFTSPVAGRLLPETAGVVRGKAAVRDYWATALKLVPDLHFELIGVYQGESPSGDQLPQRTRGTGQRGADVRRRFGSGGPRHVHVTLRCAVSQANADNPVKLTSIT